VFSLEQLVFVAAHLFMVPSDELPQVQLADTPLLLAERSLLSQTREPQQCEEYGQLHLLQAQLHLLRKVSFG